MPSFRNASNIVKYKSLFMPILLHERCHNRESVGSERDRLWVKERSQQAAHRESRAASGPTAGPRKPRLRLKAVFTKPT